MAAGRGLALRKRFCAAGVVVNDEALNSPTALETMMDIEALRQNLRVLSMGFW